MKKIYTFNVEKKSVARVDVVANDREEAEEILEGILDTEDVFFEEGGYESYLDEVGGI